MPRSREVPDEVGDDPRNGLRGTMTQNGAKGYLKKGDPFSSGSYRTMFERNPSPRAVVDSRGRILLTNQAFSHQLGFEPKELRSGRTSFFDLFHSASEARGIIEELQSREIIRRREVRIVDVEGHAIPFLLSGNMLRLDRGTHYDITLTDITLQKRLSKRLRRDHARMTSLLESIGAGLFLVDREGSILEFNRSLANLTGMDQEDIVGDSFERLFEHLLLRAEDPIIARQDLQGSVEAVAERPVVEIVMRGDPPSHVEIALFPVWDEEGNPIGWGGLVQDISELRERMAWKMELLSMLAHNIRTPLATLKGHSTALAANYRRWDDAMVGDFLEAISATTDSLTRQVDRSLALTRVEAGRLGLRPAAIHPRSIAIQAMERSAGILGDRDLAVKIPEQLPQVRVDPDRIEETLSMLIENAVRHAPSASPIEIGAAREGEMLRMWVEDDGPGIDPHKRRTIFDKFVQGDPESEGAGLGLYIARKIIEAHGGRIWAESPPFDKPKGARFTLTLPLMPTHPPSQAAHIPSQIADIEKRGGGDLILVIEDQPEIQSLLHGVLAQEGYEVAIASNGAEGLDLVKTMSPKLVLLDWMLPGMNGLAVCRGIRRWSHIPIIVVTSLTGQEDLVTALDAGADDYITKPFQPSELLARMNAAIRRSGEWSDGEPNELYVAGPLRLDFDLQAAWLHGKRLQLTPTEYRVLLYLIENRGRVLTHAQIMEHLWGENESKTKKDLFVHISRLRKKIEADPKNPQFLLTRWGVGYLFSGPMSKRP